MLIWKVCRAFVCQMFRRVGCKYDHSYNSRRQNNQYLNSVMSIVNLCQYLCQLRSFIHLKGLRLFSFSELKKEHRQGGKTEVWRPPFAKWHMSSKDSVVPNRINISVPKHNSSGLFAKKLPGSAVFSASSAQADVYRHMNHSLKWWINTMC